MQLINDLLNFSRYQSGLQKLTLAPCSIEDLLAQAQSRFADTAAQKGVALNVEVQSPLPRLQADQAQLDRVLDNLIDNALLYGGPQCQVTVKDSGQDVCIEVFDNGAPLPESVLQRMREPFWRAGDAQRPGSGLGLSIAEKAAVAFGGHLDIDSGPETGGTRVCLCLPRSQPVNI